MVRERYVEWHWWRWMSAKNRWMPWPRYSRYLERFGTRSLKVRARAFVAAQQPAQGGRNEDQR